MLKDIGASYRRNVRFLLAKGEEVAMLLITMPFNQF